MRKAELLRHGEDRPKPKPNFPEKYMAEVRRRRMTPEQVVGELMTLGVKGVEIQFMRLEGHRCVVEQRDGKNIRESATSMIRDMEVVV
ncbi:MAG: hypothetical protein Q8P26_04125 [Candidatus Levybacteria bacterium]|nr:hypothetical protein [Candidatus Levybacteria bacterium]